MKESLDTCLVRVEFTKVDNNFLLLSLFTDSIIKTIMITSTQSRILLKLQPFKQDTFLKEFQVTSAIIGFLGVNQYISYSTLPLMTTFTLTVPLNFYLSQILKGTFMKDLRDIY